MTLYLMKHVLSSNGSWIDENSWSINRSWIFDTYFTLYRAIHPGGNVRIPVESYVGEVSCAAENDAIFELLKRRNALLMLTASVPRSSVSARGTCCCC